MQGVLFSEVDEAVQLRAAFVAADVVMEAARDAVSPPPRRAEYFVLSLEKSRLVGLLPEKVVDVLVAAVAILSLCW